MTNLFHKNLERTIAIGLLIALAISCQPKTRNLDLNAMLDPELGKKIKEIEMSKTCDNQVSTATLTSELIANIQTIEAEIANTDLEHVDCQGHIVWKGHGPEKAFRKILEVSSPISDENTKINFIQIENTRTCTIQRISPADDLTYNEKELTLENGNKVPAQTYKTMLNNKGSVKLMLTDSVFRTDANAMNIHEGNNLIKIQYFGKCLKYRESSEDKQDDAFSCETAELISSKEIYLNIKINRPEVSGTSQVVLCFDGQDKKTEVK